MPSATTEWRLGFNVGSKLLPKNHTISLDGKYAVALFKSHLRVYSLGTRQSIRVIDLNRDLSDVTSAKISSQNPAHIFLFTSGNQVLVVNWKDTSLKNSLVRRIKHSFGGKKDGSILKFVDFLRHDDEESSGFLFVTGRPSSSSNGTLNPHTRRLVAFPDASTSEELYSVRNALLFAVSADGHNAVFVTTSNEIHWVNFSGRTINESRVLSFPYRAAVTSLAVSNGPSPMVALGTNSGVIQVLYMRQENASETQRLLKWHIDQVSAIAFSSDSNYLISGGQEKVLVFWQLETEKQQFLPRLNGSVQEISIDPRVQELYGISLQLTEESTSEECYMEYLVLNALDLTSKLDVNGLRPKFATNLEKALAKDSRKMFKQGFKLNGENLTKLRHDVACNFEVHPQSKNIYLPYGPRIQVYDIVRNDQSFVTMMASTLQQGKVRSETLIQDPSVEQFAFTNDGTWMCTFDVLKTPELDHLMSEDDVKYSLKFWRYLNANANSNGNGNGNNANTEGHWELCTKIIDPHGPGNSIASILQAPDSFYGGLGFITADTKGGLRLWRPRVPKEVYAKIGNKKLQQTAWTLRKLRDGTGRFQSNSVDLAWSSDASIIALGQETTITLVDSITFEEIDMPMLPSIADSRIRALEIVNNDLVVLTKHKLVSFGLVTYQTNELCVRVNTMLGGKSLLAVNTDRELLCLCVNYYSRVDDKYPLRSRVFVFDSASLKPVYIGDHSSAICCVKYSKGHSGFILIDTDYRIGILNTVTSKFLLEEEQKKQLEKSREMNTLLNNAQLVAKEAKRSRSKASSSAADDEEELFTRRPLNPSTFEPLLENMDGLPVEALFDRVMNLL